MNPSALSILGAEPILSQAGGVVEEAAEYRLPLTFARIWGLRRGLFGGVQGVGFRVGTQYNLGDVN